MNFALTFPRRADLKKVTPLQRLATLLAATMLAIPSANAQDFQADVAVLVDTSTSMAQPGMDPERASLLVAKMLADIVPGKLAVVRLLDLVQDKEHFPSKPTGESKPCSEDPSKMCPVVELDASVPEHIKRDRVGALIRDQRGSADFKNRLNAHLDQKSNNSMFEYAFLAADGVFESNRGALPADTLRIVVWLSDGEVPDNSVEATRQTIRRLRDGGAEIGAIVFGKGDTRFAEGQGLAPHRSSGPAQLVEAFTDVFRRIVQAPYKIHAPVASQPGFEMKKTIEEAWVVFYGDRSLSGAAVETPSGRVAADYAADVWPTAGAYRIAHLRSPAAGAYRVSVTGGGPNVFYGVIQRSTLAPYLLGPSDAISGKPFAIVAGLRASATGPDISAEGFGEPVSMTAEIEGQTITLNDEGRDGDEKAGDGRFSGMATVRKPGELPVKVLAKTSFINRAATGKIRVTGYFRYSGGPVLLELGSIKAGNTACAPLRITAEQEGSVGFVLRPLRPAPGGHRFQLKTGSGSPHEPGGSPLFLDPGQDKTICLATDRGAGSTKGSGEPWLQFAVAGMSEPNTRVEIQLRWEVRALSFWERWGWLILAILGVLLVLFIVYGYIRPNRFARELALSFAPEYGDLDDQVPLPLRTWRDVKIGFYRDARAFLHPDFRVSGKKSRGAVAMLLAATRRSALAKPYGGNALFRETADGDWEPVPPIGRRIHNGDVYRVGDRGPHFRISARLR